MQAYDLILPTRCISLGFELQTCDAKQQGLRRTHSGKDGGGNSGSSYSLFLEATLVTILEAMPSTRGAGGTSLSVCVQWWQQWDLPGASPTIWFWALFLAALPLTAVF